MTKTEQSKLEQARTILAAQGVELIQYKHLNYEGILRLAGIKP